MIHTREINEAVQTRVMVINNNEVYKIGDRVRVQFVAKKYPQYPYSGGGIIGNIKQIYHDYFVVNNRKVDFDDVFIIKTVDEHETFDTVPNINDEEREFWRTHWFTRDGIKRKTQKELRILDEYDKEIKNNAK